MEIADYRIAAAECRALAKLNRRPEQRAMYEQIAESWEVLAGARAARETLGALHPPGESTAV